MAFIAKSGRMKEIWLPVTPSTALAKNSIVAFSSGKLIAATSSTAAVDHVGIIERAIASTDSDYASDRLVAIKVPTERHCLFEADVTATLVVTDVGAEVDLTDASTVNRGAGSVDAVKIIKFISTTKALVWIKFNGAY
jgi:hypothetical protein